MAWHQAEVKRLILLKRARVAELEKLWNLQTGSPLPAEPLSPDPPLPSFSDPFLSLPLRPLADIAAEYHAGQPQPQSAEAEANVISSAASVASEASQAQSVMSEYVQDVQGWCNDCDVFLLMLRSTMEQNAADGSWKCWCYPCACEELGVEEKAMPEPEEEVEEDDDKV